jgi:hypothetical protein
MQFLRQIFFAGGFLPHGYCYLWMPGLVGLPVVSDSRIAISYLFIPVTLLHFVRKRRDVSFSWVFPCFGAFVVACSLYWLLVNQAPPRQVLSLLAEKSG